MAKKEVSKAPAKEKPSGLSAFFNAERILFLILFLLSLIGIGVSDFSMKYGFWYWLAMVPVFGGASVYNEWKAGRKRGETGKTVLGRQVFHWLALFAVIYLVHVLQSTGRMNQEDAGLVLLMALSLVVFLAGIHFNWRFAVLGVILGATVAMAALVDQYFWIMATAIVAGGLAVIFWKTRNGK